MKGGGRELAGGVFMPCMAVVAFVQKVLKRNAVSKAKVRVGTQIALDVISIAPKLFDPADHGDDV